jgi:hypothetical protein
MSKEHSDWQPESGNEADSSEPAQAPSITPGDESSQGAAADESHGVPEKED